MLHANCTALLKFYIVRTENFALCCCDLDLDPMTFMKKLDAWPLKMYLQTNNKLTTSKLLKVIVLQTDKYTDRQTDTQTDATTNITTPLCGW